MQQNVLLKDLPKANFDATMTDELNKFLASQGAYIDTNPTQQQKRDIEGSVLPTLDDMYAVLHQQPLRNRVGRDEGNQIVWTGPDIDAVHYFTTRAAFSQQQCVLAIIPCAVDVLAIIFQAIGTGVIARKLAQTLVIGIPPAGIIGLQVAVNALNAATTAWTRGIAIAKLGGAILRLIGFKQIIQTLKDNLKWYQWVLMGVIIVAQIVAWFASDGIALVAEIVILAALILVLIADVVNAVKVCSG